MAVRGIRGAIQVEANSPESIFSGVTELVGEVLARNGLTGEDLISIIFTVTPDLDADFPAYAARMAGLSEVPLMCATEIPVPGAMARVVRMLAHVETSQPRHQMRHVYLRGAAELRTDLPQ